ncbi:MAG: hypothetical protein JSS66_16340 [Armatimonadetes bacterium]|nr:hypothetical protein [Armatimonadota bacterium]
MKAAIGSLSSAIACGVLFYLSLPPVGWSALAWFALAPAMWAVRGRGFLWGFVTGLLATVTASVLAAFGFMSLPALNDRDPGWIYLGFVLIGLVVGVVFGLFAERRATTASSALAIACWAVLFEGVTVVLVPAHFALSQSKSAAMLALASVTGIWGVSWVLWASNLILASTFGQSNPKTTKVVTVAVALLAATGWIHRQPMSGPDRVAVIQTDKVDPQTLQQLTATASTQGAVLVVWPELSGSAEALVEMARRSSLPAIVTTYHDKNTPKPHNHLVMVDSTGVLGEYDKRRPFAGEKATVEAGSKPASAVANGVVYGLNVCFDVTYPSVIAQTAALPNVTAIVLPTLCPDTPHGVCQALHAAYVPFRCAEQGVAMLRADLTGYSLIADQHGVVLAECRLEPDKVLVAGLARQRVGTLYSRLGDFFLVLCALAAGTDLWLSVQRKRDERRPPVGAES